MTQAQAQALVAKLAGAFPREWAFAPDATRLVYVEHLAKLPRYQAGLDAVNALIETETRLPPVALVREEYRRYHDRYSPPALVEPEPSPEERAENLRRLRELADGIGSSPA